MLAALSRTASALSEHYQLDGADVATFLVTGRPAAYSAAWATVDVPPFVGGRSHRGRITLSIDPALTADEVRTFYAGLLRDYFPTDERHARPAPRTVRTAGMVAELFEGRPSIEALRTWNRHHPDEAWTEHKGGQVNFRAQVLAALKHLR